MNKIEKGSVTSLRGNHNIRNEDVTTKRMVSTYNSVMI